MPAPRYLREKDELADGAELVRLEAGSRLSATASLSDGISRPRSFGLLRGLRTGEQEQTITDSPIVLFGSNRVR